MLVNPDFSQRAVVTPEQYRWQASPQPGVDRIMLDRLGGEKARATSLVRYAPGSHFPQHPHPGGEEILVLSGTFSEDGRDYPQGWYLRSPPGSSHQPSSHEGALIFVKLYQMPPAETRRVRINTANPLLWHRETGRDVCPLFQDAGEHVSLQRLAPNEPLFRDAVPGAEMLVLSGEMSDQHQAYPKGSWIRLPAGQYPELVSGPLGASLYLKTGHLSPS